MALRPSDEMLIKAAQDVCAVINGIQPGGPLEPKEMRGVVVYKLLDSLILLEIKATRIGIGYFPIHSPSDIANALESADRANQEALQADGDRMTMLEFDDESQ